MMGTDHLGRDVFTYILYGARISLQIAFLATVTSVLIGTVVGALAGYYGGYRDEVLMRITELFQVIPRFFLALVAVAIVGPTIRNVIWIIGLTSWPTTARLVRAEFLSLRERPFVEAVRGLGAGDTQIIWGEILPNATPPIVVNSSFEVARAIILEAGLSFLGLGDANVPSWGRILQEAQPYLQRAWWSSFFPGFCIALAVLGLNLVGDGLNDAINPRLRER
jgi:peptide/nickel transport system permease protein